MSFELQFLGAAHTLDGAKHLIRYGNQNVLIDCGLFRGLKSLRQRNWDPFPINPRDIHFVILTHAHLDHAGYLPRLVKQGFRGKILATEATRDLCEKILVDHGQQLEEEVAEFEKVVQEKRQLAAPLYTRLEAEQTLPYFETVPYGSEKSLGDSMSFEFRYTGHTLGAASVVLHLGHATIGFTGDVGRPGDPIFKDPELLPSVDYLVTEATFGNRQHRQLDPMEELASAINETHKKRGVLLVPANSVGRIQSFMHFITKLREAERIPDFPMYVDSPMASDISHLFCEHRDLHKLTPAECLQFALAFNYVRGFDESKQLDQREGPMLIIAGDSMLGHGRMLNHLRVRGVDPNNTILLTTPQAAGTRGEALLKGVEEVKIYGEYIPIRAQTRVIESLSGHADFKELIDWFRASRLSPREVYLTHGEPLALDELRRRLIDTFGWTCKVPELGHREHLETIKVIELDSRYSKLSQLEHEQHYDMDGVSLVNGELVTA